jgi:hypothetical protein
VGIGQVLLDLEQEADDCVDQRWELRWLQIPVPNKPNDERRIVELEGFYQYLAAYGL